MIQKFNLLSRKYYTGMKFAMGERTAWFSIATEGTYQDSDFQRLFSNEIFDRICAAEPIYGVDPDHWWKSFLISPPETPRLPDLVAAMSVALSLCARDPVAKAQVVATEDGRFEIALPWVRQGVVTEALTHALRLALVVSKGEQVPEATLAKCLADIRAWLEKILPTSPVPNTLRFAQAALARGWPVVTKGYDIQIGHGANALTMSSSFTSWTSTIANSYAKNKLQTAQILRSHQLPVTPSVNIKTTEEAIKAAERLGWPVVVKPVAADQGQGVVTGIRDKTALIKAAAAAQKFNTGVMVEKHIEGNDHRILVVNGRMLAAARRVPGGVTGDGKNTIRSLLQTLNANPLRGTARRSILMHVQLDDEAKGCLKEIGLTPDDIPETGRFVPLRWTANISTGGTAEDVTDRVHPDNRIIAERAARLIGLNVSGIDLICPDISKSIHDTGGTICEVNGQPGFRPHWLGAPDRDINGELLDKLLEGKDLRIPTAAISGTNGKTTTCMMLHHIWMCAGETAGVNTTEGIWIGRDRITKENFSGGNGGSIQFTDPAVTAAVFELPRKGLVTIGHPCSHYDVAALTNIQRDHLGEYGIDTLEQMARLKAEVLERAKDAVVVNADDPNCLGTLQYASAPRQILVSQQPDNPAVAEHLAAGGEVLMLSRQTDGSDWICLLKGDDETPILPVNDIPAVMNGVLPLNIWNAQTAAALAMAQGISMDVIRTALGSFENSVEMNPGRFNFIGGFPFQLLNDFAHNLGGVPRFLNCVRNIPVAGKRILMTSNISNTEKLVMTTLAPELADVFDQFVLSCTKKSVEGSPEYAGAEPLQNMVSHCRDELLKCGVDPSGIITETDEDKACLKACELAEAGDLVIWLRSPPKNLPELLEQVHAQQATRPN